MVNFATQHSIGEFSKAAGPLFPLQVIAGDTSGANKDDEDYDGAAVDRLGYDSCKAIAITKVAGLSSATCAVTVSVIDCDTSGGSYASFAAGTVETVSADGNNIHVLNVDLTGAERYVKIRVHINLSATDTDTCDLAGCLVLGGAGVLPAA